MIKHSYGTIFPTFYASFILEIYMWSITMKQFALLLIWVFPLFVGSAELNEIQVSNMERIQFTEQGIKKFLMRFNSTTYRDHALPNYSMMHLIEFMDYSKNMDAPRSFCLSILNLFHTRIKDCSWIHPYAFTMFINELPNALKHVCIDDEATIKAEIKQTIRQALLQDFQTLKVNPNAFLDKVSDTIYEQIMYNEEPVLIEFQAFMVRFLENIMSKLVWDPLEGADTWESTKLIAEKLDALVEARVLRDDTELNNLYWTLITRYCYFLDSFGSQISKETLLAIQHDIRERTHILVGLSEDEELAMTKAERLQQSLLTGFALHAHNEALSTPLAN
jgi:hypothetical protein